MFTPEDAKKMKAAIERMPKTVNIVETYKSRIKDLKAEIEVLERVIEMKEKKAAE